jgi:multiple sugar transport system permease protein
VSTLEARIKQLILPETALSPAARRRLWRETRLAYLFLLPALLVILTFRLAPVFYAFYISLHRWSLRPERFVGLNNFLYLAQDEEFRRSLLISVYYVVGAVPAEMALGLLLAVLVFRSRPFQSLYRLGYFLPYVTSTLAAAVVWSWLYHPQLGVFNWLLRTVGLPPQRWMQEETGVVRLLGEWLGLSVPAWAAGPSLAMGAIIVMTIWHYTGFHMVIYLAGLSNIPRELYEAARIDGASAWALFRHITWPLLSPTTFFLLIISTIGAFQAFNQIYQMAPPVGGPRGATTTATIYIFKQFYVGGNVGRGSAAAFILFGIILALTLLNFYAVERRVHYD